MEKEKNQLDEIAKEIEKLIEGNKKFIATMLDEDITVDDEEPAGPDEQEPEEFEEL